MLDSGFMPPCFLRLSDRNMHGGGCDVATREKTAVLLSTDENLAYSTYCSQCNCLLHKSNHFVAAT